MSIQGHIENGRVVVDELISLPNGTAVRIEPLATTLAPTDRPHPDTEKPATVQQMTQAWQKIGKPIHHEDTKVSVDADDNPLF